METKWEHPLQIGDRVAWRREVYRTRYTNRPIDTGTVVALVDTPHLFGVTVQRDGDNAQVTGPWACFHRVAS